MSMKNFSDTIGNGTRDLPACSAVSQPIAPPRAPKFTQILEYKAWIRFWTAFSSSTGMLVHRLDNCGLR